MSRGTIGITLALMVTEYHRKIGTPVESGDLGFRCPGCSQPLRAREPASKAEQGDFEHISETSTCQWARGARLHYAWRSDVLARYLTPQVRQAIAVELMEEGYRPVDPDGPIYIGANAASAPESASRRPRRQLHARPS